MHFDRVKTLQCEGKSLAAISKRPVGDWQNHDRQFSRAAERTGSHIDDTIECRCGKRIEAKGIYRDPVRSSHSHFVKASGLRWISLMLLTPIPWAARTWALPFLTCLAPSQRYRQKQGKHHKPVLEWSRQMILQTRR
jgi:hypothetical protein